MTLVFGNSRNGVEVIECHVDVWGRVEDKSQLGGGLVRVALALRWILMHEGVTAAIPGAKDPKQARANAAAADLPPLAATGATTPARNPEAIAGPTARLP